MIVAIDGPSGSGKSTIAKIIASKYGLRYIDTGAMYRAFCFHAMNAGADLDATDALLPLFDSFDLRFRNVCRSQLSGIEQGCQIIHKVILNGMDISANIRALDVTANVSFVARQQEIRDRLVTLQRKKAGKNAVLEGRDIGSVVFPDADVKIFLDARESERIKRRSADYKETNVRVGKKDMALEITRRDKIDSTRKASPLIAAPGALVIDSSKLSIDEVTSKVVRAIEASRKKLAQPDKNRSSEKKLRPGNKVLKKTGRP